MKRLLFFIAFMTLGTVALIQLLTREPIVSDQAAAPLPSSDNVLSMEGVVVHQRSNGLVRWDLRADRATFNENSELGVMQGVNFRIYEAAPPGQSRAPVQPPLAFQGESRQAVLQGGQDRVILEGQVRLTKSTGLEIRSERLEYDERRQLVTAPGHAIVRSPQGVQEGASLRYFIDEERIEFENPVFYQ